MKVYFLPWDLASAVEGSNGILKPSLYKGTCPSPVIQPGFADTRSSVWPLSPSVLTYSPVHIASTT